MSPLWFWEYPLPTLEALEARMWELYTARRYVDWVASTEIWYKEALKRQYDGIEAEL